MIRRYNLTQVALGILSLCVGIVATLIAYWFFVRTIHFVGHSFDYDVDARTARIISVVIVAVITVSGYLRWRRGDRYDEFTESSFNVSIPAVSGGAFMMRDYAHRVTGTAYILTQVFLAGPLQILDAFDRFCHLVPSSPGYEAQLLAVLDAIRAERGWLSFDNVPDVEREVMHLIQMKHLEFSPHTGRFKAKRDGEEPSEQ